MFDRYVQNSLKSRTRRKRISGNDTKYKISDSISIENISLKQFLSNIDTKQELTIYLSKLAISSFEARDLKYSITYDLCNVSNIESYPDEMKTHDHEEADTLLILQALDVAKRNPSTECVIYSPDTDVFLLLIYYYHSLLLVSILFSQYTIC